MLALNIAPSVHRDGLLERPKNHVSTWAVRPPYLMQGTVTDSAPQWRNVGMEEEMDMRKNEGRNEGKRMNEGMKEWRKKV